MCDALAEILALAQEKLSEGEYLKVANFLKGLHNTAPIQVPPQVTRYNMNILIKFTQQAKWVTINITQARKVCRPGVDQTTLISGTEQIGDAEPVPFLNVLASEFKRKWLRRYLFYSMCHITRCVDGYFTQSFSSMADYKQTMFTHMRDDTCANPDDNEDENGNMPESPNDFCDTFVMERFLGLSLIDAYDGEREG